MDTTSAIKIVWQLAAREAASAGFSEIHPENFLMSLLKLAELNSAQLQEMGTVGEEAGEIGGEIAGLKGCIRAGGINNTVVRHTLRGLLGRGPGDYQGRIMHRSNTSRAYFKQAANDAIQHGEERLTTVRLLNTLLGTPTPKTSEAIGGRNICIPICGQDAPLLNEWGSDLSEQTHKEVDREAFLFPPEVKVLGKVLQENHDSGVFLVAEYPQLAHAVVSGVAEAMQGNGEKEACRIIDLSQLIDSVAKNNLETIVEEVMNELVSLQGTIGYFPLIKECDEHGAYKKVLHTLYKYSAHRNARWICGISASIYRDEVAGDISWRRMAQTIWLGPKHDSAMPSKI